MADKQYHRKYWQTYKKRQISLTLTPEEYRQWDKAAKKNGVKMGQQIKAEATAYRNQERVPDGAILAKLSELVRVLRGIGNNLNQNTKLSNTVRRIIRQRQTIQLLEQLEQTAEEFTREVNTPSEGV